MAKYLNGFFETAASNKLKERCHRTELELCWNWVSWIIQRFFNFNALWWSKCSCWCFQNTTTLKLRCWILRKFRVFDSGTISSMFAFRCWIWYYEGKPVWTIPIVLVLDCEVFPKSWKSLISISVITGEAPSPICDSFWNPIFSCRQTFASKKLTGEARKIFAKSRNLVSIYRIISLIVYS